MKPSLLSSLPAPKHGGEPRAEDNDIEDHAQGVSGTARTVEGNKPSSKGHRVPPYPHRRAEKFVPRRQADFCDGGAYPEIHMAQYPLNMGKPGSRAADSEGTLALTVNAEGDFNYDAIVTAGRDPTRTTHTGHGELVAKPDATFERPSEDAIQAFCFFIQDQISFLIHYLLILLGKSEAILSIKKMMP